jgi:hypothetical protein
MEHRRHLPRFLGEQRLAQLRAVVARGAGLFHETQGRAGLGPRYRVISGDQIRDALPELLAFGEECVRPAVEAFAGQRLRPMLDPTRAVRVQEYRRPEHAFRWHFDGDSYAALLTLENDGGGQTQLIAPGLSRALRPIFYPLYWAPRLFDWLPREEFTLPPGDLLILHGARLLHRGTANGAGVRTIVAYGYDEIDKRGNPLRDRLARFVNFSAS